MGTSKKANKKNLPPVDPDARLTEGLRKLDKINKSELDPEARTKIEAAERALGAEYLARHSQGFANAEAHKAAEAAQRRAIGV